MDDPKFFLTLFFQDIPQMQMALTRPGKDQKDILFALQTRLNESTTKDFLRKERRKLLL